MASSTVNDNCRKTDHLRYDCDPDVPDFESDIEFYQRRSIICPLCHGYGLVDRDDELVVGFYKMILDRFMRPRE